jgi:CheY-like chemotaxis protein
MGKTVIVVDDDSDTVEIFSALLEKREILVVGKGYNGKQAIELFTKHSPDVVFVDIMMPDGSGFHAIRNIRKINDKSRIIAVTADVKSTTEEKLHNLKVDGIVYKPIDMEKIIQLINN